MFLIQQKRKSRIKSPPRLENPLRPKNQLLIRVVINANGIAENDKELQDFIDFVAGKPVIVSFLKLSRRWC